ncbi:MAG: hypothetical protein ACLPX7_27890 [Xanthobacteraceae bacterium]
MTKRRLASVLVAALVVVSGAFLVVPVFSGGIGFLLYVGIFRALFPSMINWGDHDAFMKCSGAIADPRHWPHPPSYACLAMHLCANEAVLSEDQTKALYKQIRKTPGCQDP